MPRRDNARDSEAAREANVGFAHELLSTEIDQRNARKDAQESTGRWIVLTTVALMTLLLTLSGQAGILSSGASNALRLFFIATLVSAAATAGCAGATLWPRKYERLGGQGLDRLKEGQFLDQAGHAVRGQVVATQVEIAKKMDELHEIKAGWLKKAFLALGLTLVLVIAQGVALGVDPPAKHPGEAARIDPRFKWEMLKTQSCLVRRLPT